MVVPLVKSLPTDSRWASDDAYVQSLLSFTTSCDIFRNLCGGVHILDFLTREPDLYTTVLPEEWRKWFDHVDIHDVLQLFLREDLASFQHGVDKDSDKWREAPFPPKSLLEYINDVRKHCLLRQYSTSSDVVDTLPRHIAVGMKPKKIHEVTNFAAYVDRLSTDIAESLGEPIAVVDFGSGQNYLGRTLASPPYDKHVIAIERKHHNVEGARGMDVHAKLAKKEKIIRNKKEWKKQLAAGNGALTPPDDANTLTLPPTTPMPEVILAAHENDIATTSIHKGSMTYVEHDIKDGHLESILYPSEDSHENLYTESSIPPQFRPKSLVISLHSCGNLSHHGIGSLSTNHSVTAVAMIGCCYNLLTERLGPTTYKHPQLRPNHPRLEATGSAYDPHGFPMSRTLETFPLPSGDHGVRLNITARMMAVQAPANWGKEDSEAFFRRHFYRALLQRILLDRGVVKQSAELDAVAGGTLDGNSQTQSASGGPLIIGSLRKAAFTSFHAYVHAALTKLYNDPSIADFVRSKTADLLDNEDVITQYEREWGYAKKNLSVIWSLMAFSAGVVESVIAVDRWLYLTEQDCVERAWVEPVFEYKWSPRNLVVVGVKKKEWHEESEKADVQA